MIFHDVLLSQRQNCPIEYIQLTSWGDDDNDDDDSDCSKFADSPFISKRDFNKSPSI